MVNLFKLFLLISIFITACSSSKEWKVDYYKKGKFHNFVKGEPRGLWDVIKWKWSTDAPKWKEIAQQKKFPAPPESSQKPRVTFINHATFLIQVDGLNILTDPIWSERTSPVSFAGPKRVIAPGIAKKDIPKIDFIIISHNHYDHLDLETLRYFKKRDNSKIYAGANVGQVDADLEMIEMVWWQEIKTENYLLAFTPCQHFSGRGLFDRNKSLWGAFYFKSKSLSFYFAGDTGYSDHFIQTAQKYPEIDWAFLPIGAYEPRWFMKYVHTNPAEAIQAHQDLGARMSFGMHWGTFQLTDEPRLEPLEKINRLTKEKNILNFKVLDFGESYSK